jgi:chromosome segregation ATPase
LTEGHAVKPQQGGCEGKLNEHLNDPILRTFRKPITVRLREKLDELRAVTDAQSAALAKMGRERATMERDLRRANRELAKARVRANRAESLLMHNAAGGDAEAVTATG